MKIKISQIPFTLILLLTVIIINLIVQPGLLEPGTLNNNLRVFLPLIFVAVGQAFVVLTGGIDISTGAIVSIINALLATQVGLNGSADTGLSMIMLCLLVGMAAGAVNGFFIAILRLQPIITTYATSFIFAGLALLILPNPGGGLPEVFTRFYRETRPLGLPLSLHIILLLLAVWFVLKQTRYGRYLYAVGGKPEAAYQTGVPVTMVQWSSYIISGLMSACAGVALTMLTGAGNAQIGDALTLTSITAVVIGGIALSGGTGSLTGAIIGALVLSLIPNIISFANIDTWWKTFVNALIIVLALAMPGVLGLMRNATKGQGSGVRGQGSGRRAEASVKSTSEVHTHRPASALIGQADTRHETRDTSEANRRIGEQASRRTGEQANRQTGEQANRRTGEQVNRQTGSVQTQNLASLPSSHNSTFNIKHLTFRNIPPALAALGLAIILFLLSGLLPNGYGSNLDIARAQALNIVRLSVFLGIVAAGQTLVILSGSEGIDLSAGSLVTLAAILSYSIVNGQNSAVPLALLAVLLIGLLIGFVNGLGITFLRIAPFVMTLGMAGVVSGLIIVITRGSVRGAVAPMMTQLVARPLIVGIPGAIIIWLLFSIGMWLLLQRSSFGKKLFAIGTNRITARLSGVRVNRMVLATYALSGMLSGLAGFLIVSNTGVVHIRIGEPFLFPSIAAVAVGGTLLSGGKGSYWGTMAGALVLTLITSLLTTMQMPESVRRMVLGTTLLLMISIYGRQQGLRQ